MPRPALPLLLAALVLLAACGRDTDAPDATPTEPRPSPVGSPAAPHHGDAAVLNLEGVPYVPTGESVPAGDVTLEPAGTAAGVTVYRGVGGGGDWLRYTRENGSYAAWTPRPVRLAVEALARDLGVSPDAVTVADVERVEWPDACLGVREPGRLCAQVITPGLKITLVAAGRTSVYHSDLEERVVRAAPP